MGYLSWYQFKLFVEHASGISMDALHILVGFGLFVLAAVVLRTGIASLRPWFVLLFIEIANEGYDLTVERWPDLGSQLGEAARDVMLTMALPTLVLLVARWRPDWLTGRRGAEES